MKLNESSLVTIKKEGEKSMKNFVLKAITAFSFSVVFGLCIDFSNPMPSIVLYLVSFIWLLLFAIANSKEA